MAQNGPPPPQPQPPPVLVCPELGATFALSGQHIQNVGLTQAVGVQQVLAMVVGQDVVDGAANDVIHLCILGADGDNTDVVVPRTNLPNYGCMHAVPVQDAASRGRYQRMVQMANGNQIILNIIQQHAPPVVPAGVQPQVVQAAPLQPVFQQPPAAPLLQPPPPVQPFLRTC